MTSTRWLSPEEMRSWLAFLECSTLPSDYLDQRLRRAAGLTHADYHLLARLSSTLLTHRRR